MEELTVYHCKKADMRCGFASMSRTEPIVQVCALPYLIKRFGGEEGYRKQMTKDSGERGEIDFNAALRCALRDAVKYKKEK